MVRKQLEGNKRAAKRDGELAMTQGEIRQLGKELAEERRLRKVETAEMAKRVEVTMIQLSRLEAAVASLEEQAKKAESENRDIRAEIKSLLDSFRADLVVQKERKSAETKAELRELKQQNESLERKLEELRVATAEDKRLRRVEEAEARRLLKTLESETSLQVSTLAESSIRRQLAAEREDAGIKRILDDMGEAFENNLTTVYSAVKAQEVWKVETTEQLEFLLTDLRGLGEQVGQLRFSSEESLKRLQVALQNVGVWDLGGQKWFDLPKAMGMWHKIEIIRKKYQAKPALKCWEEIFSLKGNNTISYTYNYRLVYTNEEYTFTSDVQVDPQCPHQWTPHGNNIWLKTDYENWAITMQCTNQSISSCDDLWILSRTRTLPYATLGMLRDTADTNGFPKAHRSLFDQTSC